MVVADTQLAVMQALQLAEILYLDPLLQLVVVTVVVRTKLVLLVVRAVAEVAEPMVHHVKMPVPVPLVKVMLVQLELHITVVVAAVVLAPQVVL
jgi:hypothetical protein